MFDWQNNEFTADYSLGSATLAPELNSYSFGLDTPTYTPSQTSNPEPAPSGGFFGPALKAVTATADTFLAGAGKLYALDNQISSARLQQKQIESGLRVQELKTVGALDLQTAQLSASKEIGLLQAQNAVRNEQARIQSSMVPSLVSIPPSIPTPLLLIGGAIALYFAMKGAK